MQQFKIQLYGYGRIALLLKRFNHIFYGKFSNSNMIGFFVCYEYKKSSV